MRHSGGRFLHIQRYGERNGTTSIIDVVKKIEKDLGTFKLEPESKLKVIGKSLKNKGLLQ